MSDIAFAIKFIVLLTAFIAGFSVAIYAFASVVAAFRKLFNANKNKNAISVRSNENLTYYDTRRNESAVTCRLHIDS